MNLKEIFENKLKIETKVVSIESVFSEADDRGRYLSESTKGQALFIV